MFFFVNDVLNFLDEYFILYDHQFSFRRDHSTSYVIISLGVKVSHSLDTGKSVVGVSFDTVDHQILLDKLYAHGIRNNIYEWFKSYLANRSPYVIYNKSKSLKKLHMVYLKALFWALFCLY